MITAKTLTNTTCLICKEASKWSAYAGYNLTACARCGNYRVPAPGDWLNVATTDHRIRLAGWIREQNANGVDPVVTPDTSRPGPPKAISGAHQSAQKTLW